MGKKVLVDEDVLRKIIADLRESQSDFKQLYDSSMSFLSLFSLVENGQIIPELLKTDDGEEDKKIIPLVLKKAGGFLVLCTKAMALKSAQNELTDKFSFFKTMVPLFQKYHEKHKNQTEKI